MPITATGIGSGLDVESLVAQLVQADIVPASRRLALSEARFQSEISAYGSIKSALSAFQSASKTAANAANYSGMTAATSAVSEIAVSVESSAVEGAYDVAVTELAEAQSLASATYDSVDATVGEGVLTISTGTTSYNPDTDVYSSFTLKAGSTQTTVTIDSSNSTLSGVRDAINASGAPVTASIINDGSGYRLTLQTTSTGEENSISLEVSDASDASDTDASGLSALAFNASATNLTQTKAADNAELTVNGLQVVSASNSVDFAVDGLTLSLKKLTSDPVTITVSEDRGRAKAAVQGLVDGYNELVKTLNGLTSYDAEQQSAQVLTGDGTVRSLIRSIRSEINASYLANGALYTTLAELGVSTSVSDGLLSLDSAELDAALETSPEDVSRIMAAVGIPTNTNVEFVSSASTTAEGSYDINLTVNKTAASFVSGSSSVSNTNNDTISFNLIVSGVQQSISYDTGGGNPSYTAIASGVTSAISTAYGSNVANVTTDGAIFTIETTSLGAGNSISIDNVGGDAASYGFTAGSGTNGATTYDATINGESASFDEERGEISALVGSSAEGLVLRVLGGASGDLGSVSYSLGVGSKLDSLIESLLQEDGLIDARIDGLNTSIKNIEGQNEALEIRAAALERRYRNQFNGLETLISQLNTTQTYLTQALGGFVEPNTTLKS